MHLYWVSSGDRTLRKNLQIGMRHPSLKNAWNCSYWARHSLILIAPHIVDLGLQILVELSRSTHLAKGNIPLAMNEMKQSVRVHLQNSSNYQLHSSVCPFPFLCACLFPYSALLVTVCLSIPSLPLRVCACFLSFPTTFQASETWLLLTKACSRSVNPRCHVMEPNWH